MKTLYSNLKTKHLVFEMKNIHRIKKLLIEYNFIQSLQVVTTVPNLKTRIFQQNLPHGIEKLQCLFVESFAIKILSVYKISKLSLSTISGVDGKYFPSMSIKLKQYLNQQSIKISYEKSGKLFRLKKKLKTSFVVTNEIKEQLNTEFFDEKLKMCYELLSQCSIKTMQKNYRGNNIKQI